MEKKAIGIIGGMGPVATLDLFGRIVRYTDAKTDAEHIRVFIDNNTTVPDRTKAILEGGESPVPYIVESAHRLADMGADFLLIPCNTSHYFYDEIAAQSPIPVLNMVQETVWYIQRAGIQQLGLLATDGTLKTKLYQTALEEAGVCVYCPKADEQAELMQFIYDGVKAGAKRYDVKKMAAMMGRMRKRSAKHLLLACTELPIGFHRYCLPLVNTINPSAILAREAVLRAGYPLKGIKIKQKNPTAK